MRLRFKLLSVQNSDPPVNNKTLIITLNLGT